LFGVVYFVDELLDDAEVGFEEVAAGNEAEEATECVEALVGALQHIVHLAGEQVLLLAVFVLAQQHHKTVLYLQPTWPSARYPRALGPQASTFTGFQAVLGIDQHEDRLKVLRL
jgi:hypothetical protein